MSKKRKTFSIINNMLFIITGSIFLFYKLIRLNNYSLNTNSIFTIIKYSFVKMGWIFSIIGICFTLFKLIKKDSFLYESKYNLIIFLYSITSILLFIKVLISSIFFGAMKVINTEFILLVSYILIIIYSIINTNFHKEYSKKQLLKQICLFIFNVLILAILAIIMNKFNIIPLLGDIINEFIIILLLGIICIFNALKNPKIFYEKSYNISLIFLVIISFLNLEIWDENIDYYYPITFIAKILFIINYLFILLKHFKYIFKGKIINKILNVLLIVGSLFLIVNLSYKEIKEYNADKKRIDNEKNVVIIKTKEDINKAILGLLVSKKDEMVLKCSYNKCINDLGDIINSENKTEYINEVVSLYDRCSFDYDEYSNFSNFKDYYILSKINNLDKDEKKELSSKIDEIYKKLYNPNLNKKDNIKIFHDYLIDNTKLEEGYTTTLDLFRYNKSSSNGYNDVMSLLLDKMDIENHKITSNLIKNKEFSYHNWLILNLDGKWLHLDTAWDDDDNSYLTEHDRYKYFLIDDNTLSSYNDGVHDYNKDNYKFN